MIIYNALIENTLKSVEINNGIIKCIGENKEVGDIDAKGNQLIPGFIDIHTHGFMGYDTMDADFEPMCRIYAQNGTTSFLPTTMTMDNDSLQRVTNAKTDFEGANIIGFHFEGPYISEKYKGAQNAIYIKAPSTDEFHKFKNIKIITIAPELEGAIEFINEVSSDCVVSIGHTDCDYKTAIMAIESGANCLTHIYNAMPPLHHRNAGPIGAAFEKRIYAQIICDGLHVSKPVVLAAYKLFGADRMILISDSIKCAGLPDGEYESGGLKVTLKDSAAKLSGGTIAGSVVTLLDCVKKAISFGIPFDDAIKMASETPAKLLGIKKGRIDIGYDADLLIVDDKLNLKTVIIGGRVYDKN